MNGHLNDMYSLKLIESKKILLSGSGDQRIGVWSYSTGKHILIDIITGHLESVCALKHIKKKGLLFSIDSVGVVFKWETFNFTSLGKFWQFSGTELDNCFDVSSDGRFIYAPDKDNPCWLRILDTEKKDLHGNVVPIEGEQMGEGSLLSNDIVLKKHTHEIKAIKLLEKVNLIITAGKDNMILLWHLKRHYLVRPPLYDRHTDFVSSLQVIKDTGYLLTGGNDRTLNIFDVSSNFNLFNRLKTEFRIRTVRASKDGRFVISGGQNSQKVQIVSTKFLISKLKKLEPSKSKSTDLEGDSNEDDLRNLNNASMINNNLFGTNREDDNLHHSNADKTEEIGSEDLPDMLRVKGEPNFNNFETDISETSGKWQLENINDFHFTSKKKTKKSLIQNEYLKFVDEIKACRNPNVLNYDEIKHRLMDRLDNIKTELFQKHLDSFWKQSVSNLQELEGKRSIFFHDFKVQRSTQDLSMLKMNIKKMVEKVQFDDQSPEIRLDFFAIIKILESNQLLLNESKRKLSLNGAMEIASVPQIRRDIRQCDPLFERRQMLQGCIDLLQQQLEAT